MSCKFCDPIAYNFVFRCVTTQAFESFIKKAVKDLMLPLREYALRYTGFEEGIPGIGFLQWCNKYRNLHVLDVPVTNYMVSPQYYSIEQASEIYEEMLELFVNKDYPCMIIEGGGRSTLKSFIERPTDLAKEYKYWLTKNKKSGDFKENKAHIYQLFSCPSKDLTDVLFPLELFYGQRMFCMDYQSKPMTNDGVPQLVGSDLCISVNIPEEEKNLKHYLHDIRISIPRFVIGKKVDTLEMQHHWIEILKRLGERYELSTGAINLDNTYNMAPNSYSGYDYGKDQNFSGLRSVQYVFIIFRWTRVFENSV